VGRSPYLQAVHAKADFALIGRVVEVAIEAVRANSLAGTVRRTDQVSP
jgi:tRNA-2-methylthio-N6-dimethylallyladenosine synthase